MRWLYALTAIIALLLTIPAPLSTATALTAGLALGSSAALVGSWLFGYYRRVNPIWLTVVDAVAVAVFALACSAPAIVFSFAFSALWFRSLYGSVARAMGTCTIYAVGICAVLPLWRWVPNGYPQPEAALIVGTVPAMFLVTLVGRMLGASLFVREESARRDAALASTGIAMLAASTRAEIEAQCELAAAEICAATPGLRTVAVFPDPTGRTTVSANGPFAHRPAPFPAEVVSVSADWRSITVHDRDFLDRLAGEPCAWQVILAPDPATRGYLLVGAPRRVADEALLALTSLMTQITFAIRNHNDRQRLLVQARTDALTGLANRAVFAQSLDSALAGGTGTVAVLFIDLDAFKAVNDRLGHAAGDDLLCQVSARLTAVSGPDAVCARLGGDEFAILTTRLSADAADRLAERVVAAVREPVAVAGTVAFVGASVGVAVAHRFPIEGDVLLRRADQAMYAAKVAGKNQVRRYADGLGVGPSGAATPRLTAADAGTADRQGEPVEVP